MATMSTQKTRIAKQLQALGLGEFDGIKANGVYTIGTLIFKTLKEIEVYIKESKEQVKEPTAPKVISEQAKAVIETEVSRRLSLLRSEGMPGLRFIAGKRGLGIKSRTRQSLIDALIIDIRRELMERHGIAA